MDNGWTSDSLIADLAPHSITVQFKNGCSATQAIIPTLPAPLNSAVNIAAQPSAPNYDNGSISVFVSGGVAPYQYQWNNQAQTPSIEMISAGTYACTISDGNGCTSVSSIVLDISDLDQVEVSKGISIMPNPTKGVALIQILDQAVVAETYQVSIYHSSGRLVRQVDLVGQNAPIDLNQMHSGAYYLHFQFKNGKRAMAKLFKIE